MSNYVKTTDFAGKDNLASGNPLKAVKGVDLGTEFDAIAAMSATKLDTSAAITTASSPTWSGTHTFTKAATSFNNGAIYINTGGAALIGLNDSTQPANNRAWQFFASSGQLLSSAVTDDGLTSRSWLGVTRAGVAISTVSFGNTTDNPSYIFLGTGTTNFGSTAFNTNTLLNVNSGGSGSATIQANCSGTEVIAITVNATAGVLNGIPAGQCALWNTTGRDIYTVIESRPVLRQTFNSGTFAWGPTAVALVDMTPDTGTFTCTLTGCTTAPTGTATWTRVGKLVLLSLPALSATSNSTGLTFTGLPAAIQPATLQANCAIALSTDNSTAVASSFAQINPGSGTIVFGKTAGANTWTASGGKGLQVQQTISYLLN